MSDAAAWSFKRRSSELLDARREPGQVARRTADQRHGCSAGGPRQRRRRQHVVNLEVPVRGERNPRQVRIALDEGRDVFTNECGENLEAGRSTGRCHNERSPDGVTPGEHEASPVGDSTRAVGPFEIEHLLLA